MLCRRHRRRCRCVKCDWNNVERRRRQFISFIIKTANREMSMHMQFPPSVMQTCVIHLSFTWRLVKWVFYGECASTFSLITEADIRSATEWQRGRVRERAVDRDPIWPYFMHVKKCIMDLCVAVWSYEECTQCACRNSNEWPPAHMPSNMKMYSAKRTHAPQPLWINFIYFYFDVIMFCFV